MSFSVEVRANLGAVRVAGRAVLIAGPPGAGKSLLALELIDGGGVLIGDDGVTLEARGDRLWVSPPPNIAGLLEVRNVGLVKQPVSAGFAAIYVELCDAAPRHVDALPHWSALGCRVPHLVLDPAVGANAIRLRHALTAYGLPQREGDERA